jgi:hypothetical protein
MRAQNTAESRPTRCPYCGAARVAAILYGLPALDAQLDRDIEAGHIVLGGCCASDNPPVWRCGHCTREWADTDAGDGGRVTGVKPMIEDIKRAVHAAAGDKHKIATFHLQVLKNAEALEGMNAEAVCKELAVPRTYATEFRKMLSLARLMKEQGISLV